MGTLPRSSTPAEPAVKVTYFLEVISSWCFWVEPTWKQLQDYFADRVAFEWRIALMDKSGLPTSRDQCDWFYRRSGTIVRSPFMLNSGWFEADRTEYLAPNLVSEAAKDFGVSNDRVRLAIARAALIDGRKVGRWEESARVAAAAAKLPAAKLLKHAQSQEVLARARESTVQFHELKVTQRPAFLLEDRIGDRAVLSGLIDFNAVSAVVLAMLNDTAAYHSYAVHHGSPPAK